MTRGMQRAHCSPVTLDRRNSATLHRPQSREMPAASKKNKTGLNLFCRKKKNTRLGKDKMHFKPKDDKTPKRECPGQPQRTGSSSDNAGISLQNPNYLFFSSGLHLCHSDVGPANTANRRERYPLSITGGENTG